MENGEWDIGNRGIEDSGKRVALVGLVGVDLPAQLVEVGEVELIRGDVDHQ